MTESESDGGGPDLAHPAVPVVIGLVVLAAGGYLFYSGMQASANAAHVDATVLTAEVVDNQDTATDDPKRYTVRVEYEYAYDGQSYTSTTFCPGAGSSCKPSSDFRTEMQTTLEDYPEGGTITAYVPPASPGDAFLVETGPSLVYLGVAGVGVLLVVLGGKRLLAE